MTKAIANNNFVTRDMMTSFVVALSNEGQPVAIEPAVPFRCLT
jgi:hypothetical protein